MNIQSNSRNQKVHFVRYNREFAITVSVITKFDCTRKCFLHIFVNLNTNKKANK
jgi:hypothetical protein